MQTFRNNTVNNSLLFYKQHIPAQSSSIFDQEWSTHILVSFLPGIFIKPGLHLYLTSWFVGTESGTVSRAGSEYTNTGKSVVAQSPKKAKHAYCKVFFIMGL